MYVHTCKLTQSLVRHISKSSISVVYMHNFSGMPELTGRDALVKMIAFVVLKVGRKSEVK